MKFSNNIQAVTMKTCFTLLLVFGFWSNFANGQFPSFVKLCKLDSKINQCIKENIENAKTLAPKGIPKLFTRPTNPYKINKIATKSKNLEFNLTEFNALGFDKFDLSKVNLDLNNNQFDLDVEFQYVEINSNYILNGNLIGIYLNSQGFMYANISDVGFEISMKGKRFEKDGKNYLDFSEKTVKMRFDSVASVYFKNLFAKEELTEAVNQILNRHMKQVVYEVEEVLIASFPVVLTESIVKVFQKFSLEELFAA